MSCRSSLLVLDDTPLRHPPAINTIPLTDSFDNPFFINIHQLHPRTRSNSNSLHRTTPQLLQSATMSAHHDDELKATETEGYVHPSRLLESSTQHPANR